MYWPTFTSEFLQSIAKGLKKRSKALKHKSWEFKCERVLEQGQRDKQEKLEFDIRCFGENRDTFIRLFVWDDRWAWIDARESAKKEQLFEWDYEGRLLGDVGPQRVVTALEETLERRQPEDLDSVWRELLANGPQKV